MAWPRAAVGSGAAEGVACTTGVDSQELREVQGLLWSDVLWNEVGEGDLEDLSP